MLTFEEAREALTEISDALPPAIFDGLNGGILLLPDTMQDEHGLYILGQYHYEPNGFGRYVTIHYGSMVKVYGHLSAKGFQNELSSTLRHELVHHLEHQAGDRTLEIKDAMQIERYLRFKRKKRQNEERSTMESNKGPVVVPEELAGVLESDDEARFFFESLTDGYKRGYCDWVGGAKQPATRQTRAGKALIMLQNKQKTLKT
ncbi:MAG: YdeI/OmpD-associated family protein [Oscillospiraceae bacterium]|nr:YdeI/OmpD-associated family protein [Oscillospiraceae bacterium]